MVSKMTNILPILLPPVLGEDLKMNIRLEMSDQLIKGEDMRGGISAGDRQTKVFLRLRSMTNLIRPTPNLPAIIKVRWIPMIRLLQPRQVSAPIQVKTTNIRAPNLGTTTHPNPLDSRVSSRGQRSSCSTIVRMQLRTREVYLALSFKILKTFQVLLLRRLPLLPRLLGAPVIS